MTYYSGSNFALIHESLVFAPMPTTTTTNDAKSPSAFIIELIDFGKINIRMGHYSTTSSTRTRRLRRISRQHGWNNSDCRRLCTLLVLWSSFASFLWVPSSSTAGGTLLPFFPVACAAEVSLRQQPTKDLDDEPLSSSTTTTTNNNNREDSIHSRSTQIIQSSTKDADDRRRPAVLTLNQLLRKAGKKGLGGGIPGFIAGVCQVRTAGLSGVYLLTVANGVFLTRVSTTTTANFVTFRCCLSCG